MIRTYIKWRYRRRERTPSFTFHPREHEKFGPAFGHYLSQRSAVPEVKDPWERRRKRRRIAKYALIFLGILFLCWLGYEAIYAIRFF